MVQELERVQLAPEALIPRVVGRYSPVVVDHAEGIHVWDVDGNRWADFTSGIAVTNTGHCHPKVVRAIQEQAAKIIHAQQNILAHEPMMRAAVELTATLPANLNQAFWTNSGAEAIEGAIKLAKVATRRPAAILVETIAGEGGYLVPTKRWLKLIRELCDRHGILMILDEIQTGVGRTGKMWGFEHFDVVPDVITVAKGIASGLPVSAVVSDKAIMDKWAPGAHGGTYGGNAVGTAAAAATLQVIREEGLVDNAARMGGLLMDGLRQIQADHPVIGEVRGLGLMVACEFVTPDGGPNPAAVNQAIQSCQRERVLLINCGTYDQAIRIIPPLVVTADQIEEFLGVFRLAVAAL